VGALAHHFDQLSLDTSRLFIAGEWRSSTGDEAWRHVNPATLELLSTFPVAN
jgi:acyl-CoA reductase-like NAD-dependent aldehyde dehydrogenase